MNNKILIVDDEYEILKLLETVLRKEGFTNIYTAQTSKSGLEEFKRIKPDLVLLDVMLPDGDGYEICKHIRNTSRVPILFFIS